LEREIDIKLAEAEAERWGFNFVTQIATNLNCKIVYAGER